MSESLKRRLHKLGLRTIAEDIEKLVRLDIQPGTIMINRVVDVNDRMLRDIDIGLAEGGKYTRRTKVDISVSSELMAILALAKDFGRFKS